MIRDKYCPLVDDHGPVEIMKDEEAGEPETGPPERIGNPGIKVVEVMRRGITRDHGRAFLIIISNYG